MPQDDIAQLMQLGLQSHQAGQLQQAEHLYRQVLAQQPNEFDALHMLGVLLSQRREFDVAVHLLERAITLNPNYAQIHFNLGLALKNSGHFDRAVQAFRRAIALCPGYPEALNNLGTTLKENGQLHEAIVAYRQAIALRPGYAEAHFYLGNALRDSGQFDQAMFAYGRAIAFKCDFTEAHNNLGMVLRSQGQLDEAVTAFRQAIALNPNASKLHNNLGVALVEKGLLDEAIGAYRLAISTDPHPEESLAFENLLFALCHHPQVDSMKLLEETRRWARLQRAVSPGYFLRRDQRPDRKLRIGYLSPFLCSSADAHFFYPLLKNHDRTQFEIRCYSTAATQDEITRRMKLLCDGWTDISGLSVDRAVELIRSHEIDILASSSNPVDHCRRILASRMAPVQLTWLALASSPTGLATVDYRISDPTVDPPEQEDPTPSENTIRLPETACCYDPLVDLSVDPPAVAPLPSLNSGAITFGSMHRMAKLNPLVIATWAGILRALPSARLRMLVIAGTARFELLDQFERLGVDRRRFDFIGKVPRREYLQEYNHIDIMLDTFPYAGHTTVFDSLWMGVPVVTLLGEIAVGRVAASALQNIGLSELIGNTPGDYVRIATALANDLPRLKELRSTLRGRMEQSPLMDGPLFARGVEAAYRQMWQSWCNTAAASKR